MSTSEVPVLDREFYVRDGKRFVKADLNGAIDEYRKVYEDKSINTPTERKITFDSVWDLQRQVFRTVGDILLRSDIAWRRDRTLQRMMRHDPDVMSPLLQRQLSTAMLEWSIEPEDDLDPKQVEQAQELERLIRKNLRRPADLFRHLSEGVWFGRSAANIIWLPSRGEGGETRIAPTDWFPFHPDSLAFTRYGDLCLRVSHLYKGEWQPGENGPVRIFTSQERGAVCLHVWNPTGPDYEDAYNAEAFFGGRGLREICWFVWLMKQTTMQLSMTYAERYGMGTRIGYYPSGSDKGKSEMQSVLRNLQQDVSILMPRTPGVKPDEDAFSIEIHEPKGSNVQIFMKLLDFQAGQLKEQIIGQTATTEGTATGLGSSVGDHHAETFQRLIKYDALSLSESLTEEIVRPMSRMNFGETPYAPRFSFKVEDVDLEEFSKALEMSQRLGLEIPKAIARARIGIPEPREGEETVGGMEDPYGGDPGDGTRGGGTNPNDVRDRAEQNERFSKAFT